MNHRYSVTTRLAALALGALLASTCAIADKGDKGEKHGHGKKHEYHDDDRRHEYRREDYPRYDDRRDDISIQLYFGNNDRRIINEYYAPEFRAGHCPPGLAKKGNGCMPPGQAKKWHKGRPLPQGIAFAALAAARGVDVDLQGRALLRALASGDPERGRITAKPDRSGYALDCARQSDGYMPGALDPGAGHGAG